ncbi:MAG: helix-turn-helix transcriptional regulator [Bacteroidales bacterium]|nr:helix-turn-helix transcriptional regulator [Bacteroidales bacterium]
MKSNIAERILANTPKDVEIFARLYGDLVVRINSILKEKNYSQKKLAESLGKKPSEINKWLKGDHNFTLRSLAKLEAELGEPILYIPKTKTFKSAGIVKTSFTVHRSTWTNTAVDFTKFKETVVKPNNKLANVS